MITRPEIMEGIRRHIQPIGGQENLNILEVEPGHVRLSIELTAACLNLYGNAHGGHLVEGTKVLLTVDVISAEIGGLVMGRKFDDELEVPLFAPKQA